MLIDTSALVAIAFREPERDDFIRKIVTASERRMSVISLLEATTVIEGRRSSLTSQTLDDLLKRLNIELEPVSIEQAEVARRAWRTYGKGRHPAGLNFGDCFTYALASTTGEPLLFKGEDFGLTDLETA